jgi:periplasmic protein TonB
MTAISHAINIGTLALWLSVTAFGTVGILVPVWHSESPKPKALDPAPLPQDFILGTEDSSPEATADTPAENNDAPPTPELPTPPELPTLPEFQPLPEIPAAPAPRPTAISAPAPAPAASTPTQATRQQASKPRASTTSSSTTGTGSALSNDARLKAGRMPSPAFPAYSRRNNQTGTVVVEFIVDASGNVISAYAKSSSNWPLLDNEAVRTVRRWRFPPGGIMKLERPIVFKLN